MDMLIKFLAKGGVRKIGVAIYMYGVSSWLLYVNVLPAADYVMLVKLLIIAVFAGNTLEHYIKSQEPKKDESAKV